MTTSKLFLYNFWAANIYETFFFNVCFGKTACFYFCPHFYKAFVGGSTHHQSVIYEQGRKICCCCLECFKSLSIKTDISEGGKQRLFYWFEKTFNTVLLSWQHWSAYGQFFVEDWQQKSRGIVYIHT